MLRASLATFTAETLEEILADLHQGVGVQLAQAGWLRFLLAHVLGHLARLRSRCARLAAMLRTGALPPRLRAREAANRRPVSPAPPLSLPPQNGPHANLVLRLRVPTRARWLLTMLGDPAQVSRERLQALLADPEIVADIEAAPQLGRVLRPLCRALGVKLIPALRLRRRRGTSPAEAAAASPIQFSEVRATEACRKSPAQPPPSPPVYQGDYSHLCLPHEPRFVRRLQESFERRRR